MRFDQTPLRSSRLLEAMRASPALLVHGFIVAHVVAWAAVLALVPSAPPREVVDAAILGREGLLGTGTHPPLAAWLGGLVDSLTAGSLRALIVAGVLTHAVALWATFQLARSFVGDRQGAFAVLLLAGVWWVTWAPPALEPDHLLMALFPLAALHLWRAAGEGRQGYWILVAVDLALLVLAKYAAALLIATLALALLLSPKGRATLRTIEPWGALAMAVALLTPHLLWLMAVDHGSVDHALSRVGLLGREAGVVAWAVVALLGVAGLLGLVVLVALAVVPNAEEGDSVPRFPRPPLDAMAQRFLLVVGIVPFVLMVAAGMLTAVPAKTEWLAPVFVFSGVVAMLLLGETIPLYRQVLVGRVLMAMVAAAPLLFAVRLGADPWRPSGGHDMNWPSAQIARWFTDIARIRTGQPLAVVAGDSWVAGTIALASADRPTVLIDGDPKRSPWVTPDMVARHGVLVVWRIEGADASPPPALRARFPGLAAEQPRAFAWSFSGRLPPIRLGWSMVLPTSR